MQYRLLGNTGIRVSAIALGCEGFIGKSREEAWAMYDYAFAHGINFIDMDTSNPDFREQLGRWVKDKRERFVLQSHLCTVWENGQYLRTRDFDKVKSGFGKYLAPQNEINFNSSAMSFNATTSGAMVPLIVEFAHR
jgi:aryl-alcohol dehydrogenase-like predicted oxidoreductase